MAQHIPNRETIELVGDIKVDYSEAMELRLDYIALHGMEDQTGDVLHFRLFLVSDPNRTETGQSVSLNMRPSFSDPTCMLRGKVLVKHNKYTVSYHDGAQIDIDVTPGTTAGTIFDYIFGTCKLDQYIFDESGLGCRHWCITVLEKLEEAGLVEKGASTKLQEFDNVKGEQYGDQIPTPRARGQFY